jgi:hypothetical protein
MAAKKSAKKASEAPPVRVPPKLGTQGPESGPTGETVVDADAPGAGVIVEAEDTPDAKAQAKAQQAAEDIGSERRVKVEAMKRGFIGNKVREEGDVFILALGEGEAFPSWVKVVTSDEVATTPLTHSSEAEEEYVDGEGIGHTPKSIAKDSV